MKNQPFESTSFLLADPEPTSKLDPDHEIDSDDEPNRSRAQRGSELTWTRDPVAEQARVHDRIQEDSLVDVEVAPRKSTRPRKPNSKYL
uniref:Uncharacterized protein n=1 Tax=Brassica campestris TaxID=3711 RepID=M4FGN7_BRACM